MAATQFIVFIVIAFAWFPGWMSTMKAMLRTSLVESFHADLSVATFPGIASTLLQRAFMPLSVIGGLTVLVTLSVHLFVTKFGFSFEKLTPDFGRFNPVTKIKNMAFQGPMALLQASAMLVLFGIGDRLHRPAECRPASHAPVHELGFGARQSRRHPSRTSFGKRPRYFWFSA